MNRRIIKSKLAEFHVAVLATDGFEESELTEPGVRHNDEQETNSAAGLRKAMSEASKECSI
jgi:hypothetical protein